MKFSSKDASDSLNSKSMMNPLSYTALEMTLIPPIATIILWLSEYLREVSLVISLEFQQWLPPVVPRVFCLTNQASSRSACWVFQQVSSQLFWSIKPTLSTIPAFSQQSLASYIQDFLWIQTEQQLLGMSCCLPVEQTLHFITHRIPSPLSRYHPLT